MKFLRLLLLPFSALYWFITFSRNYFYDKGIFKSYSFHLPVIAIGNLSTGGTGKTPMAEYLIRLLSENYRIATLSRGYKRKSKGFVLGNAKSNAAILGDEPYQFYKKFPNIDVAVDADRKQGIEQLEKLVKPEVILLDDAYQHRRVKAGLYILLTAYTDLYSGDFVLPAGNLRESRSGAKRSKIIVVTKCPHNISREEQQKIIKKLKPEPYQKVYFTFIEYGSKVYSENEEMDVAEIKNMSKVLVAGIAKPKPFFDHLQSNQDIIKSYPDHHDFTENEVRELEEQAANKIIITTEKDYVRLMGRLPATKLFYLPIRSSFIADSSDFDKAILDYVGQSTGNR